MCNKLIPNNSQCYSDNNNNNNNNFTTMAEHVSGPIFSTGTISGAPLGSNHVGSFDSVRKTCTTVFYLVPTHSIHTKF